MPNGFTARLIGRAQDLGGGRYGVVVEHDGATYYVEHAVSEDGLHAKVWDEDADELQVECTMDWDEVITRMFSTWQQDGVTGK